ncbi:MAG: fucose isomerase [Spirochaetes bacterium]|nr:fucose isomerase [Spirochaetota bacterium]
MKHPITLGIVCLARKTFDYRAANEIFNTIKIDLEKLPQVECAIWPELVIEIDEAQKAARFLAQKRIDALVCISGTFHLGHLLLELHKLLPVPVLLWGLPELPYDGGKIRLNSVCGVNLNASNLYKAGIRNYHAIVSPTIDEDWIDAIRVRTALSRAHVGIAGFRAHGFFNLGIRDLDAYQQFGVLIDHYELIDVYEHPVSETDVSYWDEQLRQNFDITGISEEQAQKTALLAARIHSFIQQEKLDALAIRCWPEFALRYGISPCAAMSLVQSNGTIVACEGDVEGALSMIAHKSLGAKMPYLFDFSQVDFQEDTALLWHCGVAPCNLWDGKCVRSLDTYFAGGKGVTADFVLKAGDISILRFDNCGDSQRIFLQRAHGIPMDKKLRGTYVKVKFDVPVKDVLEKVIYNGIAHHASMAYGDFIRPCELLGRINGWQIIQ